MCSYIDTVYNEAMRIGYEQGERRGEESMAMLGRQLLEENWIDELKKSYDIVEYINNLMDQYGIKWLCSKEKFKNVNPNLLKGSTEE